MEKMRNAGIETNDPTTNARISDKLASVIKGPTSSDCIAYLFLY